MDSECSRKQKANWCFVPRCETPKSNGEYMYQPFSLLLSVIISYLQFTIAKGMRLFYSFGLTNNSEATRYYGNNNRNILLSV